MLHNMMSEKTHPSELELLIIETFSSNSGKALLDKYIHDLFIKNTFKSILAGAENTEANYNLDGILATQKLAYEEGKSAFIKEIIQTLHKFKKVSYKLNHL